MLDSAEREMCAAINRRYLLGLLYLRRKYRKSKYERQYWVHPLLTLRYLEGSFYTLFEKLREDNIKFFNYFRMSKDTFDFLVERLENNIKHQDTPMRACIPPKEMIAVTIRYLASGATFTDLHYYYRIGISTMSKIVQGVQLRKEAGCISLTAYRLGYEIALNLASRGCRVIIADVVNTSHAVKEIIKETRNPNVVGKSVNLASFKSVREFATDMIETEKTLHILMCNAGIAEIARDKITEDGLQKTMQINYFSHFLLISLLLELLKKSAPSRIVFTSSLSAYMSNLTVASLESDFEKGHVSSVFRFGSYADSKLALTAAAHMFGERLKGTGVTANAALLNGVKTKIFQHAAKNEKNIIRTLWGILVSCFGKNIKEGAQTLIHLAVDNSVEDVTGQGFYEGMLIPYHIQPFQINKEFCDKLWDLSVKCTKLEKEEIKC